jgi:GNAT superfamily N-acetyltransferase
MIRAATAADGPVLRHVEVAAGARFAAVGLADVASHDPFTLAELEAYALAGRSWVATAEDVVIGYTVAGVVDGCAHLDQVSVLPEHQGRGIGRALIERVEDWAREAGLAAITLTTFADVPWNGPLYEHLGYRTLADAELGPQLRAVREEEARVGLDPDRRVCMRKDVTAR